MSVELVGTRIDEASATTALLAGRLDDQGGCVAVVSAYWDASSFSTALDLAARIGGKARLVLWIAGATSQSAWDALVDDATGVERLDVRFVGAPTGGGIFHPKVVGVLDDDGVWSCALVGSANFTAAGHERNVELGVLLRGDEPALDELAAWFDALWDEATPAHDIDVDEIKAATPSRADDEARRRSSDALGIVDAVHAGDIVRVPKPQARKRDVPLSLASCHGNARRIEQYLDVVVGRVAGNHVDAQTKHVGQRKFAGTKLKRIHLAFADGMVQLRMWPGDTLEQAKPLYADADVVRAVLALRERGWKVRPNFHWGYQQGGRGHRWPMPGTLSLDEYAAYWIEHAAGTWQQKPDRFDEYVTQLEADRVIDAEHRAQFRRIFQTKPLDHATPRPGLAARFDWPLEQATQLDSRHELTAVVLARVNEMLDALEESTLGNVAASASAHGDDMLAAAIDVIEAAVEGSTYAWGEQIAQDADAVHRLAALIAGDTVIEPYVVGFLQYTRDGRSGQGALDVLRDRHSHAALHQQLREHIMHAAGIETTRSAYMPRPHPTVVAELHELHARGEL